MDKENSSNNIVKKNSLFKLNPVKKVIKSDIPKKKSLGEIIMEKTRKSYEDIKNRAKFYGRNRKKLSDEEVKESLELTKKNRKERAKQSHKNKIAKYFEIQKF